MKFDPQKFFEAYRTEFGALKQSQVDGLNSLLFAIEHDATVTDIRHLAYMLATVRHETASTFKPIREYGKGKGRKYGVSVAYMAPDGTTYRNVYYGRGYVQLTWLANYLRCGQEAGVGDLFARQPDLVMEPGYAFRIMVAGMTKGLFTGKRLSDYIAGQHCDYRGARRIINGVDQAATIAGYATRFERILRQSIPSAPPIPLVVPPPPPTIDPTPMRTVPVEVPEPTPADSPASAAPPLQSWRTTWLSVVQASLGGIGIVVAAESEIPAKYKWVIGILGVLSMGLKIVKGWLTADTHTVESIASNQR